MNIILAFERPPVHRHRLLPDLPPDIRLAQRIPTRHNPSTKVETSLNSLPLPPRNWPRQVRFSLLAKIATLIVLGALVFTTSAQLAWHAHSASVISRIEFQDGRFYFFHKGGGISATPDGIQIVDFHSAGFAIAYGNDRFVTISRGTTAVSTNGYSWTSRSGGAATPNQVAFGNGRFVLIDATGALAWSTNGTFWTAQRIGTNSLNDIIFANNRFVIVSHGAVFTSETGTNWTATTIPQDVTLTDVAFGASRLVAVGIGGILVSSDGLEWQPIDSVAGWDIRSVCWDGHSFHAALYSTNFGKILHSADGLDWNDQTEAPPFLNSLAYGNGLYLTTANGRVLDSTTNAMFRSVDSRHWESSPDGRGFGMYVCHGPFGWVSSNRRQIYRSPDGVRWTRLEQQTGDPFIYDIEYALGYYILPSGSGSLLLSTNGVNWISAPTPIQTSYYPYRIKGGNGIVAAIIEAPAVVASTRDFHSWTNSQLPIQYPRGMTFAQGRFIVGGGGAFAISTNALDWEAIPTDKFFQAREIHGNDLGFVAAGIGKIMFSKDGRTWTNAQTASGPIPSGYFNRVAYGNGTWVVIDIDGVLGISSNGLDWTFRQLLLETGTESFEDIDFDGARFIVGTTGGLFSSIAPTLSLSHPFQTLHLLYPASHLPSQILSSQDLIEWSAFATFPLGTLGGNISIPSDSPHKHFKFRAGASGNPKGFLEFGPRPAMRE